MTGLSRGLLLRYIVLSQAIRRMIPTLFNQFIRLLKFTPWLPAATYLIICYILSQVGRWLNARYAIHT